MALLHSTTAPMGYRGEAATFCCRLGNCRTVKSAQPQGPASFTALPGAWTSTAPSWGLTEEGSRYVSESEPSEPGTHSRRLAPPVLFLWDLYT